MDDSTKALITRVIAEQMLLLEDAFERAVFTCLQYVNNGQLFLSVVYQIELSYYQTLSYYFVLALLLSGFPT
jgi:hypothetical protein